MNMGQKIKGPENGFQRVSLWKHKASTCQPKSSWQKTDYLSTSVSLKSAKLALHAK